MILYVDTTDFNKVIFAVADGKVIKKAYKIDPHESHKTLEKLEEFLLKSKIRNLYPVKQSAKRIARQRRAFDRVESGIKKIVVNKGPGSYTGVRVGVTMAQALGFAWQAPVKFLQKIEFDSKLKNLL